VKNKLFAGLVLIHLAVFNFQLSTAHAQSTAFTYQGRLNSGGGPASGLYDYRFKLYSDPLGNTQVGSSYSTNAIPVTNGLFTTTIDFGAGIFTGSNYWLEVDVKTNLAGSYTVLSPLQGVTPTPYAIFATTASNVSGTVSAAQISGAVANGNLPSSPTVTGTVTAGSFAGNGASVTNVNATTLNGMTAGNFWQTGGNNVVAGQFLGSINNQPVIVKANSQEAMRFEPTTDTPNVVGGYSGNYVQPGLPGVTIGGGGTGIGGQSNIVIYNGSYATIAGGFANTVLGYGGAVLGGADNYSGYDWAVIGGGQFQTNSGYYGFIGGGSKNQINSSASSASAIGGGYNNNMNGSYSVIGGGWNNNVQSYANVSTIGGGYGNLILGDQFEAANGVLIGLTIAGGAYNTIYTNNLYSTIGGGQGLAIQSGNNSATISGGWANSIQTNSSYSLIGGGSGNTIGANATYAVIPGGKNNAVGNGAQYAFAAGQQAQALHQGAFVWADSQNAPFASTATNQFLIRATGNVGINKNNPATALDVNGAVTATTFVGGSIGLGTASPSFAVDVLAGQAVARLITANSANGADIELKNTTSGTTTLGAINFNNAANGYPGQIAYSSGSGDTMSFRVAGNNSMMLLTSSSLTVNGTFVSSSDRNVKQNFQPVDSRSVLEKVSQLPVQTWAYKRPRHEASWPDGAGFLRRVRHRRRRQAHRRGGRRRRGAGGHSRVEPEG